MIKMILATDINGGIGFENKLPWHIPEDLQYFKEVTQGQTVVMGRKTFESLPFEHGLPNRENVVLTTLFQPNTHCNKTIYTNIQELLKYPSIVTRDTYVIGGKSIYDQLFPYIEEIHHTVINKEYECDTFMDTNLWTNNPDFKIVETIPLCDDVGVNIWRKIRT